jgi:hypothetical protein
MVTIIIAIIIAIAAASCIYIKEGRAARGTCNVASLHH